jgi:thioredoxin reductase (NADPH)
VTVVHRRDEFRAEKILQQRLFDKDNIEVIWDTEVVEYLGAQRTSRRCPPRSTASG